MDSTLACRAINGFKSSFYFHQKMDVLGIEDEIPWGKVIGADH